MRFLPVTIFSHLSSLSTAPRPHTAATILSVSVISHRRQVTDTVRYLCLDYRERNYVKCEDPSLGQLAIIMILFIDCCAISSVANPGSLSRILIFIHPGSQISDPGSNNSTKRGGKFFGPTIFCSHKYPGSKIQDPEKNLPDSGSRIKKAPDLDSKRLRISDPQHWPYAYFLSRIARWRN